MSKKRPSKIGEVVVFLGNDDLPALMGCEKNMMGEIVGINISADVVSSPVIIGATLTCELSAVTSERFIFRVKNFAGISFYLFNLSHHSGNKSNEMKDKFFRLVTEHEQFLYHIRGFEALVENE